MVNQTPETFSNLMEGGQWWSVNSATFYREYQTDSGKNKWFLRFINIGISNIKLLLSES